MMHGVVDKTLNDENTIMNGFVCTYGALNNSIFKNERLKFDLGMIV
tara:strand:- start:346 stop:483 length:138 start_codon:yes stop_codon:yes gene_type:complete